MASKPWRDVNIIYQIYPRSFMDSNNDGVGDIRGIIEKIEYLRNTLGVDALWLSPIFQSPKTDWGYDVSDYCAIDPEYGTMQDFEELLARAHEQEIKIMLDLVPNHTSAQHAWFQESRQDTINAKRDWYVWRGPKSDGSAPNNWQSISGGSSWAFDEQTGQYYLHSFTKHQPDLNWDNPNVREAIKQSVRFWFDKGVDGFRVDAVWPLSKVDGLPDDELSDSFTTMPKATFNDFKHMACKNGPHLQEYLKELSDVAAEYDHRFFIFEYYPDYAYGDANEQYRTVQSVNPRFASSFYFDCMHAQWSAAQYRGLIQSYYTSKPADVSAVMCFGNHDQSRLVTRVGEQGARAIAVLQCTLPGVPTMYYGEEIGMHDVNIPSNLRKDGFAENAAMGSRDAERTPMQWTTGLQAGFTTAESSWLPIADDYAERNVATESKDIHSFLSLYKSLLSMRSHYEVLRTGTVTFHDAKTDILHYTVSNGSDAISILINFSPERQSVRPPQAATILLSSLLDVSEQPTSDNYELRPSEAVVFLHEREKERYGE